MRLNISSLCALAIHAALATPVIAGTDFFLKLEGVEGELSGSGGGGGGLAVASWSFGASNPTSVGSSSMSQGRAAAAPTAEPAAGSSGVVTVSKSYDKASPKLQEACANGSLIKRGQLTRCVDGACRSYELRDVVISSITLANDGRGKATESLSLNFAKVEYSVPASAAELRESPSRPSQGGSTPTKPKPQ